MRTAYLALAFCCAAAAQGHVTESKGGGKLHGQAALNFNFDTLIHGGQSVPISSSIDSIENSKGRRTWTRRAASFARAATSARRSEAPVWEA